MENNINKIDWSGLSRNINAINLLNQNTDKIDWYALSSNENIFELDYLSFKNRMDIIREELIIKIYHPIRFERYLNMGYDIADEQYIKIFKAIF